MKNRAPAPTENRRERQLLHSKGQSPGPPLVTVIIGDRRGVDGQTNGDGRFA